MKTPEAKVKDRIKKLLNKHNVYYFMPVQTGLGSRTLDFLCCVNGKFLAIEAKAPDKYYTPQQECIARNIRNSSGKVLLIDGSNYELLEEYLILWTK